MSHTFAFICPVCIAEDSIVASKCRQCGGEIKISTAGIQSQTGTWSLDYYLSWMKKTIKIKQKQRILKLRSQDLFLTSKDPVWRVSQKAILRQGLVKSKFRSFAGLIKRNIFLPKTRQEGVLVICAEFFYFCSSQKNFVFSLHELTCITTNGHYFEFKIKGKPYYQIHFLHESPLKYEVLFQKWVSDFYLARGKKIFEFQPNFRFSLPAVPREPQNIVPVKKLIPNLLQSLLRWGLLLKLKIVLKVWIKVTVIDSELLPKSDPYVMILNHQSIFDPFVVLAFLDSKIGFLAKSTSFSNSLSRFFLYLGRAIPTTRFETDPSVIRHIQKYLESGIPVGIFPEGERCWDGQMQAFKYSVIRLLLKTRIPVVPVIIQGGFAFMPRWGQFPNRQKLMLHVRAPFSLVPNGNGIRDIRQWLEQHFLSVLNQTLK